MSFKSLGLIERGTLFKYIFLGSLFFFYLVCHKNCKSLLKINKNNDLSPFTQIKFEVVLEKSLKICIFIMFENQYLHHDWWIRFVQFFQQNHLKRSQKKDEAKDSEWSETLTYTSHSEKKETNMKRKSIFFNPPNKKNVKTNVGKILNSCTNNYPYQALAARCSTAT